MNVVAQFFVYPVWNNKMGSEMYGNVIFLISVMNILSVSVGVSCNYTRMTQSSKGETYSTDYIAIMSAASLLAVPYALVVALASGIGMGVADIVMYVMLTILTMWRYYADVEFRLNVDYKGYFLYYLTISIGYLLGMLLFAVTGAWALALIPGELAGLVFVGVRGKILHKDIPLSIETVKPVVKPMLILFGSEVLSALIFNGDRVLLKLLLDGTAVACFYQASLIGKTMSLISTPLNSVIIGHLSRFKGKLSVKLVNVISAASAAAAVIMTAVCTVGSHIMISLLYPDNYDAVKDIFIISNLALILYFIANMINVVVLRFSKSAYSLTVNIIYAAAFCAFCIPLTVFKGFGGFCMGYLLTCATRYLSALAICYIIAFRKRGIQDDPS